jgi:hypothetical protein
VDRWVSSTGRAAIVRSNIGSGSIVLAGPKGELTLLWRAGDKERRRAVPVGTYRLRTTRVVRKESGEDWFISTSGPAGKPRHLRSGETARLDIDPSVHFNSTVRRKSGRLQLGFTLKGADGRGLSVYRSDRRVPVTYRILSADGRVLGKGKMNYG